MLTQASKLPHATHLGIALMEEAVDGLIRLTRDIRILLGAYRIEPSPGQLEALERHAAQLAEYLLRIYSLGPGDAPELEALAGAEFDI